jgi:hypothetical protein
MTPFDLSLTKAIPRLGAMRLASAPTDPVWEILREMTSQSLTARDDRS